jgi:hypothetical protein
MDASAELINDNWLNLLATVIVKQNPDVAAYGFKMKHSLNYQGSHRFPDWISKARWYTGRPIRDDRSGTAGAGDTVHYCKDWFFVLLTKAIYDCDIPDIRLVDSAGDVVIGEQLYQNRYRIMSFNNRREFVDNSDSRSRVDYPWV